MSMTKAARELGVSPGAVSHQVRHLEEFLGVPLFLRETRKVSLTAAGQDCLPALSAGLDSIEEAVRRMTVAQRPGRVSVSVEASFAEHWLIPHLESFAKDYPGIVVELLGRPSDPTALTYRTHMAIAYGTRQYQGLVVQKIMSETIFPVCSPSFQAVHKLENALDFRRPIPLIHDDTMHRNAWYPTWQTWLASQGFHAIDPSLGHRFGGASMAIVAARHGHGVILGRGALVERDLAEGTLVAPLGTASSFVFDYLAVGLQAALDEPQVAVFRDWLMATGRNSGATLRLSD